jgi:hypothetical protein
MDQDSGKSHKNVLVAGTDHNEVQLQKLRLDIFWGYTVPLPLQPV